MVKFSSIDFKKMRLPLILFLILIIPLFIGPYIPYQLKAFLYSVSLSMKAILLLLLPLIIFSFLFASLLNLKTGVLKFIVMLVCLIYISNCTAIFTGLTVGTVALKKLGIPPHHVDSLTQVLVPLWDLHLPKLIRNEFALIAGFVIGLFFSFRKSERAEKIAKTLYAATIFFLKKIFTPLLPIFILGFVFKLEQDQLLGKALRIYGPVFFIVVGTQFCYMMLLYFLVAKFQLKRFITYIKNVLPATITGFCTVSSAATMPVLTLCTEKNLDKPEMAELIVPATINIHTIGSALGISILCITTMMAFGHTLPEVGEMIRFGLLWGITKFGVAAVPGGGIIVVTPLLETYFHFSSEMIGLITAIYMLFDPFGTATNVTGNGFFAIAFSKLYNSQEKEVDLEAREEQEIKLADS